MGILEYLSQTNNNTDFISEELKFKFIDDLSFIEILNLISQGLCSFNLKSHVASDINSQHNQYLPTENLKCQSQLNQISKWTKEHQMKLNVEKSKYMIFNFTEKYQFNTRLYLENELLEQVREERLLGVVINEKLTWESNTQFIVRKAYTRMIILHNLFKFGLSLQDMVEIYILYIRSILENSAVVWHSSLTAADRLAIERVQKVAFRIILSENYQSYDKALEITGLPTLEERRILLCKKFAIKCLKNAKTCKMFPLNLQTTTVKTRKPERFYVQPARTERLKDSAIPYMQRLLNTMYR